MQLPYMEPISKSWFHAIIKRRPNVEIIKARAKLKPRKMLKRFIDSR